MPMLDNRPLHFSLLVDANARNPRVSPSLWHGAAGKRVILNMTAEPETTREAFHSSNGHMAIKRDWGFRAKAASAGNNDLALQALASFESLGGDAIESFAAEVFGNALD